MERTFLINFFIMYNYSIIIPHHNTFLLLDRLVKSIPLRNDIQVIIVDDASDENIFLAVQEKYHSCKHIEIYRIEKEESKWAGHARNIGIQKAQGKWILFADSDDMYTDNFIDILDNYKDSDFDSIFFNWKVVDSNTLQPTNKVRTNSYLINDYLKNSSKTNLLKIKYKLRTPWCKMIRRELIEKYNIDFEEVIKGNDILFSLKVGHCSKKIKVLPDFIYIYTYRVDNMTFQNKSYQTLLQDYQLDFKLLYLYKYLGLSYKSKYFLLLRHTLRILRYSNNFNDLKKLLYNILFLKTNKVESHKYISIIKKLNRLNNNELIY